MPESVLEEVLGREDWWGTVLRAPQAWRLPIDFQFRNGQRFSMTYSHILWMTAMGNELFIHSNIHTIQLIGRNMVPLYEALIAERVTKVKSIRAGAETGEDAAPFVYRIIIRQKRGPKRSQSMLEEPPDEATQEPSEEEFQDPPDE